MPLESSSPSQTRIFIFIIIAAQQDDSLDYPLRIRLRSTLISGIGLAQGHGHLGNTVENFGIGVALGNRDVERTPISRDQLEY